jgi:hypothetical protein
VNSEQRVQATFEAGDRGRELTGVGVDQSVHDAYPALIAFSVLETIRSVGRTGKPMRPHHPCNRLNGKADGAAVNRTAIRTVSEGAPDPMAIGSLHQPCEQQRARTRAARP